MSNKPIFVATHPRACSTAFERVFMTRKDTIQSFHEPFGDAYYFGPERLAERYEDDEKSRIESGYSNSTYKSIFDDIARGTPEGKRAFIKDMAQYWIPPSGKPATIAPSLTNYKHGVGTDTTALSPISLEFKKDGPPYPYDTICEQRNPTIVPAELLKNFHFAFLIRHPRSSIPSYYRCTIPPLDAMTGFYNFREDEAGYEELRRLFDYLRDEGQVGPKLARQPIDTNDANGGHDSVEICVIDADDLLDNPSGIIEAFCKSTGVKYEPEMLYWDNEEDQKNAKAAFEKWKGFHEDAIESKELKARTHKKTPKSDEELLKEWTERYGEKGAKQIANTVKACVPDYEYLKQFAIKVPLAN